MFWFKMFKLKPWFEQKPCFCVKTMFYTKRCFIQKPCCTQTQCFTQKPCHVLAGPMQALFAAYRIALSMVAGGTRRRRLNLLWNDTIIQVYIYKNIQEYTRYETIYNIWRPVKSHSKHRSCQLFHSFQIFWMWPERAKVQGHHGGSDVREELLRIGIIERARTFCPRHCQPGTGPWTNSLLTTLQVLTVPSHILKPSGWSLFDWIHETRGKHLPSLSTIKNAESHQSAGSLFHIHGKLSSRELGSWFASAFPHLQQIFASCRIKLHASRWVVNTMAKK